MCTIRDIVEIRAVNPPVQLWTVRKGYTLFRDDDNRLCAALSDNSAEGASVQYRTNEMLIDALEAGERLENGYTAEDVLTAWVEKYGFTPMEKDHSAFSEWWPHWFAFYIPVVYRSFCRFLKARYGYDVFPNKEVQNTSAATCAKEFDVSITFRQRVVFDGCTIKTIREDSGLLETLFSLLGDYVTTDNGWQQFTCRMCGKTSLRRNPKKCYCNECTGKRYQVSRQKKRLEGR